MAFDGSAIVALLDGAVSKGAVHGVPSRPVPRSANGCCAGLFNSYYWIDRSKGIGGVLMTQLLPFFDMPVIDFIHCSCARAVGEALAHARNAFPRVINIAAFHALSRIERPLSPPSNRQPGRTVTLESIGR